MKVILESNIFFLFEGVSLAQKNRVQMLECGLHEEREAAIKGKTFTPEQITLKPKCVLFSQGQKVGEVSRKLGTTEQTFGEGCMEACW